jgi:hypothetical protein
MPARAGGPIGKAAHAVAVIGFFGALTFCVLSPGLSDLWRSNIVPVGATGAHEADINLIMWILAWDWHALTTDPLSLYQANIFYPARDVLAGSEHLLGHLPAFAPAYAISGNPVFAGQFNVLLCFALSGSAVYVLLRHWGTGVAAALFAGCLYTFASARLVMVGHPHLLAGYYLPLAIVFFDRCLREPRLRWALLFALCLFLQMACSYYLAYIASFALLGYGAGIACVSPRRLSLRGVVLAGIAVALALAALAAISIPYLRIAGSGVIPEYSGDAIGIAGTGWWRAYLDRAFPDLTFSRFTPPRFYVGISVLVLGLAAFGRHQCAATRGQGAAAGALGSAVVCYLMGLGPAVAFDGVRYSLPYAWAMDIVPGFSSMRVPSRFGLFVPLGLACLAGLGLDQVMRRARRFGPVRWLLLAAIVAIVAWDLALFDRQFRAVPQAVGDDLPPIYRRLAGLPRGPLLELPLHGARAYYFTGSIRESRRMLHSTYHWWPILNGQSGYAPPSYRVTSAIAQALPEPAAVRVLARATGVRYILVHTAELSPEEVAHWQSPPGMRRVIGEGRDFLFEIEERPPVDLMEALLDTAPPTHTLLGVPLGAVPEAGRRASLKVRHTDPVLSNEIRVVSATVTNASPFPWPALSPAATDLVAVRCRWLNAAGKALPPAGKNEGLLPLDLFPGESIGVDLKCATPRTMGRYFLDVAVVQGDVRFASDFAPIAVTVRRPGNPPR